MTIQTGAGVTFSVSNAAFTGSTLSNFQAATYVEVGTISDISEFGDSRSVVSFTSLDDSRVQKARGAADGGEITVTFAFEGSDSGQGELQDAFNAATHATDQFAFKVVLDDAVSSAGTTYYFAGRVTAIRNGAVSADAVITKIATIAVTSGVLSVAAS